MCQNHAEQVLTYAKELLREEKGDVKVVIPSAILHDIGIKECERKYNSIRKMNESMGNRGFRK